MTDRNFKLVVGAVVAVAAALIPYLVAQGVITGELGALVSGAIAFVAVQVNPKAPA